MWATQDDFENWTRSDSFRAAHKSAGTNKPLYIGGPQFEGFVAIQEVKPA
jgi:heme-degrading monooxygenase HmoA